MRLAGDNDTIATAKTDFTQTFKSQYLWTSLLIFFRIILGTSLVDE